MTPNCHAWPLPGSTLNDHLDYHSILWSKWIIAIWLSTWCCFGERKCCHPATHSSTLPPSLARRGFVFGAHSEWEAGAGVFLADFSRTYPRRVMRSCCCAVVIWYWLSGSDVSNYGSYGVNVMIRGHSRLLWFYSNIHQIYSRGSRRHRGR